MHDVVGRRVEDVYGGDEVNVFRRWFIQGDSELSGQVAQEVEACATDGRVTPVVPASAAMSASMGRSASAWWSAEGISEWVAEWARTGRPMAAPVVMTRSVTASASASFASSVRRASAALVVLALAAAAVMAWVVVRLGVRRALLFLRIVVVCGVGWACSGLVVLLRRSRCFRAASIVVVLGWIAPSPVARTAGATPSPERGRSVMMRRGMVMARCTSRSKEGMILET